MVLCGVVKISSFQLPFEVDWTQVAPIVPWSTTSLLFTILEFRKSRLVWGNSTKIAPEKFTRTAQQQGFLNRTDNGSIHLRSSTEAFTL